MGFAERTSLANQVAAVLVGIVTALLAAVGAAGYFAYSAQLHAELREETRLDADQLATSLSLAMWNIDPNQIERILLSKMQAPRMQAIVVQAEDRDYALARDAAGQIREATPSGLPAAEGLQVEERAVAFNNQTVGQARIYVTPRFVQQKLRSTLVLLVLGVLLVDLLLVLGVYTFLWARVLRPLRQIDAYARGVNSGQRDAQAMQGAAFTGELVGLRDAIQRMVTLLDCRYQELQGANERFWSLVRSFPTPLGLYSPNSGRIQFVNQRFVELFGYTLDDIPDAASWYRQAYPDAAYRQRVVAAWNHEIEMARGEGTIVPAREYSITCKSGEIRVVEVGGVLSDELLLAVFVDVTERRQAEADLHRYQGHLEELVAQRTEELVQARDMAETANRSKSVFLANMSHELRTPLNSVIGFSQLMVKDPQLTQAQKRNLDIIRASGSHLLNLINDILELSKIEAGKMPLAYGPVDLAALLTETTSMLRARAEESGLKLDLEIADVPPAVLLDGPKLRQVLLNLLSNAIKFTRQGGVVLAVRGHPTGDDVSLDFSVTDTGVGISPVDQRRVFEPFVQAGGQPGSNQGTGLGLTVSREYVEMMGGRLALQSQPGVGSTFSFTLVTGLADPGAVVAGRPRGAVVGLAPQPHPLRIVIAEDGPETRLLLSELLTPLGFEVVEAEDGPRALEAILAHTPDLVLMDWRMPGLDGLEVTRRVRAQPALKQPRIIMLTAHAFEENRVEALGCGADDFMRKPIDAELLYSLLEQHLNIRFEREGEQPAVWRPPRAQLQASDLDRLAPDARRKLEEAVRELNPARIGEVLDEIGRSEPEIADSLRDMVAAMQYRQLWQVLGIVG